MKLKDRTVVITGATGGLGRVATQKFAENGARLVLVGTNEEKLATLKDDLQLQAYRVLTIAADLGITETAQKILDTVIDKFGNADILLHFVGGWSGGKTVAETAADDLANMIQQHLWTTFYMAQAFVPHFVSNGWGRIAVISSQNVGTPPPRSAPYTVGKSAQEALLLTLAQELKGTGVTANMIRVKAIDVLHNREQEPGSKYAAWTTPEEITAALLYLCSDEAGMVNGARLPLYGKP